MANCDLAREILVCLASAELAAQRLGRRLRECDPESALVAVFLDQRLLGLGCVVGDLCTRLGAWGHGEARENGKTVRGWNFSSGVCGGPGPAGAPD
jgi:hypothetical protein